MQLIEEKLKLQTAVTQGNSTIILCGEVVNFLQQHADELSEEDKTLLKKLLNAVHSFHYSIVTINNIRQMLGVKRSNVDRYFNVENGEVVEVDREHFNGNPDYNPDDDIG